MVVTVSDENGIKQYNISKHIKLIFLVLIFLVLSVIGSLSFYVKSLNDKLTVLEERIRFEKIVEKSDNQEVVYLTQDKKLKNHNPISLASNLVQNEAEKRKETKEKSETLRILALTKAKKEKEKEKEEEKKLAKEKLEREKALRIAKLLKEKKRVDKEKAKKKIEEKNRLAKLKKIEKKKRKERAEREKKKKILKLAALKKAKAKKEKLARLKKEKEKEKKRKKEKLAKLDKLKKVHKKKKVVNKGDSLPSIAKSKLGKRYVWGAVGPSVFDCSGFTSYVYKKKGISIPRTSRQQSKYGKLVDRKHLKPGDLIFFDTSHRRKGIINHVGMYIGNNQFIHASSAKKRVVITNLSNFYSQRFKWARRVIH